MGLGRALPYWVITLLAAAGYTAWIVAAVLFVAAWVGQFWDLFYAGHTLELANLKAILEYRHANNLPIGPYYTE